MERSVGEGAATANQMCRKGASPVNVEMLESAYVEYWFIIERYDSGGTEMFLGTAIVAARPAWWSTWSFITGVGITSVFGIIGIVVTLRTAKTKRPYCKKNSINVISPIPPNVEPEKVKVFYEETEVETLTATEIHFWNGGRATINHTDIAESMPLKIVTKTEGCKILDIVVRKMQGQGNIFTVEQAPDGHGYLLKFDFLDKGYGAWLQVLHTGNSSSDIALEGKIKGVRKITEGDSDTRALSPIIASFGILTLVFSILAMAYRHSSLLRTFGIFAGVSAFFLLYLTVVMYANWRMERKRSDLEAMLDNTESS